MRLRRYSSARDWLQRTRPFLEREEAKYNLLLGIANRLAESSDLVKATPYLACAEDAGELGAAALMTPPRRLIAGWLQPERAGAVRLILEDLIADGWQVPGVVAETATAQTIAGLWAELTGESVRPAMSQRIYELRAVTPPHGVPGQPRLAEEADRALVAQWMRQFIADTGLPPMRPGEVEETAAQRVGAREALLWEVAGMPVSMAVCTRYSSHGVTIGYVFSPPEFRRNGYASACVAALSQQMLDTGWEFCALYTDLGNPVSNSIYQRIGYRPVCDSQEYDFSAAGKEPE